MIVPTMPDLATIGRALYGRAWRRDLAEALGRDESTVGRWLRAGTVPRAALADLSRLCEARGSDLLRLAHDLPRVDAPD